MWLWRLVQHRWLDALIFALVVVGILCVAVAIDQHGLNVFGYRWRLRRDPIHAYALALIPIWMAAVLHLLRQRPR
jgi:di/tricarboxylate transporter